jgi:hypothetical protein
LRSLLLACKKKPASLRPGPGPVQAPLLLLYLALSVARRLVDEPRRACRAGGKLSLARWATAAGRRPGPSNQRPRRGRRSGAMALAALTIRRCCGPPNSAIPGGSCSGSQPSREPSAHQATASESGAREELPARIDDRPGARDVRNESYPLCWRIGREGPLLEACFMLGRRQWRKESCTWQRFRSHAPPGLRRPYSPGLVRGRGLCGFGTLLLNQASTWALGS